MIRSRACHLANVYQLSHRPTLILARRLQTLPSQETPPKTPIPPRTNAQKPQVQLRPGPIKSPQNTPATPSPAAPAARPPPPAVQTVEPFSLKKLKDTTAKDFADAEAHGVLAPPPPGAGWAKSTLHKAIQIAKFYYRGVKLVYSRGKIAREINRRIASGGAPLERWEHRMLHTQSADMRRLVPFVLIAVVLEEIIPLIAIWAPELLPSTCILPSQRERIRQAAVDTTFSVITNYGTLLASLTRTAESGEIPLSSLSQRAPTAICGLLHLSSFGVNPMLTRRIRKHLTFIEKDDAFLAKEDLRGLSAQDLLQALHERGIITRGLDHTEQVKQLSWWLKSVNVNKNDTIARRIYLVALMGSR
ncbi:hypothetical protein B0H19DRAFT_1091728 [Mycena capillaripes]|nr:hypothetical protein B0H19DRAFT_1091728 [Mycena capillaripes]